MLRLSRTLVIPLKTVDRNTPSKIFPMLTTKYSSCAYRRLNKVSGAFWLQNRWASTIYDKWNSYEKEPGVRYNVLCKSNGDKLVEKVRAPNDLISTVWETFQYGCKTAADRRCLGWRDGDSYKWWTYSEVANRVEKLAKALEAFGLQRQDRVGIYASASPTWLVAAMACTARSLVIVPIHDTFTADNFTHIINQVETPFLFVDNSARASRVISQADATPTLHTVVSFTALDKELFQLAKMKKITLKTFDELLESSANNSSLPLFEPPKPDDLFVILYTSGTTGVPKGVPHTHRAITANVAGLDSFFWVDRGKHLNMSEDDVTLHYLPLSHSFGLTNSIWFFYLGASIGFFGGDILKIVDDAALLKPTHLAMVPRIMNRVYSKVMGELEKSKIKSALFWYAYKKKKELLQNGLITNSTIWDKLLFKKVQNLLGGRVWVMSVGSAPIATEVLEFWRIVFGCLIMEGYGQTECVCGVTGALDAEGGSVGHPISCNAIKLADVPEIGYLVSEGRGEICVKGPNVMTGYYKRPDLTAEILDKDGWLHTGDIGEFLPNGTLRIIDRKKNVFKLAQGVYITPERIENIYLLSPEIFQIFVDGDSLQSYLVAIVVPDPQTRRAFAFQHNLAENNLASNENFVNFIFQAMVAVARKNGLQSYEHVKAIRLVDEPFSIENDLLTPTMKNKRLALRKRFLSEFEALYKAGPLE